MCGICGIVGQGQSNEEKIRKVQLMIDTLSHRGPEFASYTNFGSAVLGHTRLKIMDTSDKSNQPFLDEAKSNALVYNGECYNFRELRERLKGERFDPATEGDTEVVFHQLIRKGVNGLEGIDGIFGLGFWDDQTERLLLARDKMGVKPLYYSFQQGSLYFASELRSLLDVLPGIQLSQRGLAEYLAYQSHPSQSTLLEDIHMLPAGSYIVFSPGHKEDIVPEYYYKIGNSVKGQNKNSSSCLSLYECLSESVKKRLISDVPIGAFLSGGIDSTAMVALMSEVNSQPVKTFTFGFNGEDERPIARKVSERYGTDHCDVELHEREVSELIPDAVEAMDMPSGDAINTYVISKFAKEAGITVALSGLGGDELFGGYPSYSAIRNIKKLKFLKSLKFLFNNPLFKNIFAHSNWHTGKINALLSKEITLPGTVKVLRRMFLDHEIEKLGLNSANSSFDEEYLNEHQLSNEFLISIYELIYYTRPLLLKDTDQMSMAHGLEVRVPFMDSNVWDKVLSSPLTEIYPDRSIKKSGLIKNIKSAIPEYVYKRSKQGFILPMDSWIKGPLKDFTADGLFNTPLTEVLSKGTIENLWSDFNNHSKTVSWSRIWTLSVLGHWLHKNKISV